jgi:hypothetical protein
MSTFKHTTLLALVGACLLAAGCGSDEEGEPIPAESAATLQDQLDNIQARLDNGSVGACEDILSGPRGPNLDAVEQAISGLPDNVSADVRSGLEEGFDRLFTLVEDRCTDLREEAEAEQPPETEPEPEPEPVAPPETVTETVPPPETETVPPPETETLPPPETGEEEPPVEEPPDETAPGDEESGGVIAPGEGEG